jgi:hypothetical protein
MRRRLPTLCTSALVVLAVLAATGGPGPSRAATRALPIRPARPADNVAQPASRWTQEWRVLAFDPASRGFLALYLVGGLIPLIEVEARSGSRRLATGATLPYGLLKHEGPGVTIANLPDNAPPSRTRSRTNEASTSWT